MTPDLHDRTVLVVGGAGYVGSVLSSRLLDAGARVRVLDQLVYDNGFALHHLLDHPRFAFTRGDVRDRGAVTAAATGATDVVLLAALVGDPVCKRYPELAEQVNHDAAVRLHDSLSDLGVQRFVFTSTCSNYGIHDTSTFADETSDLNPQSLYAETKIAVEKHVLARASQTATTGTVLRVATAYGLSPRARFDLTVSQFTRELAAGGELVVYDADTWRPYCHVQDLSSAVLTVLDAPRDLVHGEVFNVGDADQQFTKRMIVDEVLKHVDGATVTYREGDTDPRNYRVAFDKISSTLGFRTRHTVQDYVGALTSAVQAGIFTDVRAGDPRCGNYAVAHLE
ncbi:UDP-glucose 4-epimerase [Pseudonocardia sp. Ae168_Ps1]|uniref:NAD-dependent epimerase/dehydratase family protein n=1 Tax=unclassified Pseudonocardia TaxID=2619320 RepID=UPI00094AA786|nr:MULTISPECIES: SDR family oxidoreductase [unclassified Pseudonocardia]OLL73590.1 UDP-glucose 4-epimerase [Pseudonocardia sp. Ae150A_Ps1]OLL79561.1 UDP-glucose 4-epimerase [Pseudonocardia sp. Ae168_Ps1]OLL86298.1 UDP-glucose 4-epimerase [Pseudonocardia sp. Ae263_Ps1]OLL93659.1 UDP-glucose 4-epimerase [Pseudonocardia sp. Ae356_Ps1]